MGELRKKLLEQARKDRDYIASLPLHQRRSLELQYAAMMREIAHGAAPPTTGGQV